MQPDWSNHIITVYLIGQFKQLSDMTSFHCSEIISYHFTGIIFSHSFSHANIHTQYVIKYLIIFFTCLLAARTSSLSASSSPYAFGKNQAIPHKVAQLTKYYAIRQNYLIVFQLIYLQQEYPLGQLLIHYLFLVRIAQFHIKQLFKTCAIR